jgi:hypothetical protein
MFTRPYWDERLMIEDNEVPHVLAIGDSWFWYPVNNLLNPIFNVLDADRCILAIGNNGAEAVEYVGDKYRERIRSSLDAWKGSIEAVIISGGGNDFAGLDDMFRIIRTQCNGFTTVDQCFNAGEPGKLFDEVGTAYRSLINMVFAAIPAAKIFLHNYDRAIPTGKGFVGNGNWLKEPMKLAHVDPKLHQGIVNRLLFEFTQRLKARAAESGQIFFVDSARLGDVDDPDDITGKGTLTSTEWANELHPKPKGFNKIAKLRWRPAFKAAGMI